MSLSARRAWIEISIGLTVQSGAEMVALRKESVDRNPRFAQCLVLRWPSLSARRAWIEMIHIQSRYELQLVALRKESVDRNTVTQSVSACTASRSPQGERG